MREIELHVPTERAQDFREQRSGSDAINVVVAEDDDRFAIGAGVEQTFDRFGHAREQIRIGKIFQTRLEKTVGSVRIINAAIQQALREQASDAEVAREGLGEERLGRGDDPAVSHLRAWRASWRAARMEATTEINRMATTMVNERLVLISHFQNSASIFMPMKTRTMERPILRYLKY